MTDTVRVFVNATAVDVPRGSTALDAVHAWNEDVAEAVSGGARLITDSRGLPIADDAPVSAGSIFRVIARSRSAEADAADAPAAPD